MKATTQVVCARCRRVFKHISVQTENGEPVYGICPKCTLGAPINWCGREVSAPPKKRRSAQS